MAFSASSSPVSVSGNRRLWFREAVALLASLAPASFSSYLTAIYESEPLLFICLSFLNLVPHAYPVSYDSRCALVVYELRWKGGFEWFRLNSDDGVAVRRRIAESGAEGRR
ncbi:hypothetical protein IGI04_018825 [Brassica rapa subsp. trilocularis]|uniref:Uncharacterized protein n=1 Tax=Brassica rapa subsp. trilocularis TaxID=1813537 RepID=A0ABQ7MHI2_BRACM|nr:hypothetical protein IGI04_018825 [Brassica rapa subsp. trilocularis]